jgi:hypothetical protein
VSAFFVTTDTTLGAWNSADGSLTFYVFRILPAAQETLTAYLDADPDVTFSIDARNKFTTNLDSNASFPSYDKSQLTYTYSCTHPTSASDATLAASNNCCALVFSWNGTVLSKNNISYTKYCDGAYTLTITAKNPLLSTYTQDYVAVVNVKYDCSYLRNYS